MKRKKGQADIVAFIIIIISLLIIAPIMLKIVNSTLIPFHDAINQTSPEAAIEVEYIHTRLTNSWDYLIMLAFAANLLFLIISAFLVNTHPVFLVFYIISAAIIMMFAPYTVEPVKQILGMSPEFTTELTQLPLTNFALQRFSIILLGIIIITGIITYGKFRGGGSDQ